MSTRLETKEGIFIEKQEIEGKGEKRSDQENAVISIKPNP